MREKPTSGPGSPGRTPLKRPGVRDIAAQSFRDFVGKDVQQTTTYSYVWSADQAGHFMLGFAPTFLIHWIALVLQTMCGVGSWFAGEYGLLWSALLVMSVWTLLELYDLFDSVRKIRRSTGYFTPNTLNLIWNVITALFYFLTGAAVAGASQFGPEWALAAVAVLFAVQLPVAIWWLRIKILFQQAGLPYLYRLPNFDGVFDVAKGADGKYDPVATKSATDFIVGLTAPPPNLATTTATDAMRRQHLILTGPLNSGKSSLAVGLATEFAFAGGIGRFTDMSDLVQYLASRIAAKANATAPPDPAVKLPSAQARGVNPIEHVFDDGRILWRWPSVDLLVIDDVIELLLPVRRAIEEQLGGDGFASDVEKEVFADPTLVERLGGAETARRVLAVLIPPVRERLLALANPKVIARSVAEEFDEVVEKIKLVPRVVWVLGDMILPNLFEEFVRNTFGFTDPKHAADVLRLNLLPPEPKTA